MGVPSDHTPAEWRGGMPDTDPYTKRDYTERSVRNPTTWTPPDVLDETSIKGAVNELLCRLKVDRFCPACYCDLSPEDSPRSATPEGFKAATGCEKQTAPPPQGGHDPVCPVPVIILWLDGKPSIYTRTRTA